MSECENCWVLRLLTSILECGPRDLDRLKGVFAIAEKFGIDAKDVIANAEGEACGRARFNNLMRAAMRMTLERIASILDAYERTWVAERLREWEIYINYLDSWFNIESLDSLDEDDLKALSPVEVAMMVAEELDGEAGSFNGSGWEGDDEVLDLVRRNYWLSGDAEADEGDPLAGLENSNMFARITPVKTMQELWDHIRNYQGIFRYKNLYFANHMGYGCFVYIVKAGEAKEFENITFEKYDDFKRWLLRVLLINEETNTISEFCKRYYNR